jgi:hypothetical protein
MKKFIKNNKTQNWEQNHKSNSDEIDERINQLEKKSKLSKILLTLEIRKVDLNINGILEITGVIKK